MTVIAHVGGFPVEETLAMYGPALLLALGAASASLRARLRGPRSGRDSDRAAHETTRGAQERGERLDGRHDQARRGTRRHAVALLALAALLPSAPMAWALGKASQKPGTAGCISETGTGGACQDGTALNGAFDLAASPDGMNAYVSTGVSNAVAVFDRDSVTGALTQKSGTAGCIVRSTDLKNNDIRARDVRNGTLAGIDVRDDA